MTRQEVINELNDIRSAIETEGELVAEESLDVLADRLMNEDNTDISEEELAAINEMIYGSFIDPETICVELSNMLMSNRITTEDVDPFVDDYWDGITPEKAKACKSGVCEEELKKTTPTDDIYSKEEAMKIINMDKDLLAKYEELLPYYESGDLDHSFIYGNFFNLTEDESKIVIQWIKPDDESTELIVDSLEAAIVIIQDIEAAGGDVVGSEVYNDLTEKVELAEGHYGSDSIIDGDIPGKTNGFLELIAMRFNNMGYDEYTYPLYPGTAEQMWNPFGEDSLVMFGESPEFFQPIVEYIKSEVAREDSAWWNRDYEVCEVDDSYRKVGAYALCIEAKDYDRAAEASLIPANIKAEYARRRKLRRASKKELIPA